MGCSCLDEDKINDLKKIIRKHLALRIEIEKVENNSKKSWNIELILWKL